MSPVSEASTGIGTVRAGLPKPSEVAIPRRRSAPTWTASCANGPLQDFANAVANGTVGPGPHGLPSYFSSVVAVLGSVIRGAAVTGELGWISPASSAAAV